MTYTEDDARRRWCPMYRISIACDALGNTKYESNRDIVTSDIDGNKQSRCIGSACMAWRWKNSASDHGFCGMAGRV